MPAFSATLLLFSGQAFAGVIIDAAAHGAFDAAKVYGTMVLLSGLAVNGLLTRRAEGAAGADKGRATGFPRQVLGKLRRPPKVVLVRPALVETPEQLEEAVGVMTQAAELVDDLVPLALQLPPEHRVVSGDMPREHFSGGQGTRYPAGGEDERLCVGDRQQFVHEVKERLVVPGGVYPRAETHEVTALDFSRADLRRRSYRGAKYL
jgi:hypothetical protein